MNWYFFSYFVTRFKSLVKFFNAFSRWFLSICCCERGGEQPQEIWDKERVEDSLLIGNNSLDCFSLTGLLTLEVIPKLQFCCHSAWMLYVFEASFSKSRALLLYLIWILFEPFLYPPQRLFSPSFFYFNSACEAWWLTTCFVLDCSCKSFLSPSPTSSSSPSESILSAFSFHNQVAVSFSSLVLAGLVSIVLALSLYTLGRCNKLWTELASSLLFLKSSTEAALTALSYLHWRLECIVIKLKQLMYSFNNEIRWLW